MNCLVSNRMILKIQSKFNDSPGNWHGKSKIVGKR
jgi:hypothetical protein